jgi:hypothetical protein
VNLPNRASDAGPEPIEELDWRDYLYVAGEDVQAAGRIESDIRFDAPEGRNRNRIEAIDHAIAALQEAKELLLCR